MNYASVMQSLFSCVY